MHVDMGQSPRLPNNPPATPDGVAGTDQSAHHTTEADELLALLGDEYTYRVFEAVVEEPRTGRELVEATDASKATVYRRLGNLEEAGLVESTINIASDGNHRKRFHAVVTAIEVRFDADGFSVHLESERRPNASATGTASAQPPADD